MASSSFSPNGAAFDAIVIGSGAGGLTAATRLVQSGLRVALLEKNSWLGGMSHGWDEDGYHWDHGGHIFMGYRLGGKSRELFKRLGLDKRVEMVPVRLDYQCMFPGDALSIEAEITQTVDSFSARFPHEREGIARLFQTIQQIAAEAETSVPAFQIPARPGQRGLLDPVKDSMTYPILGKMAAAMTGATRMPGAALLKYQFKTMKEMIEEHVTDQRLRGYLGMIAGGMSASPAVCSAVVAAVFFVESLQVMWMPKGGFAKIGEGLLGSFQEHGGHVFTSAEATHILMENDHVAGVETADGRRFMANFVISNADARRTLLEMVEPHYIPPGLPARLAKMEVTPSVFQVLLGVDIDLTPHRESIKQLNFMFASDDIDESMQMFSRGNIDEATLLVFAATLHSPEMAPPGKHAFKIESYTRLQSAGIDWERDKERIADTFIKRAERVVPNLGKHIEKKIIRTPADIRRDYGGSEGAFAGWSWSPAMLAARSRPSQRTEIPGLYLAGHWTAPSAGVPWVMLSGFNTAGMVIADHQKRRAGMRRIRRAERSEVMEEVAADR